MGKQHTRRAFAGLGAAGLAASCASMGGLAAPGRRLAPVLVREERIIRVDVGLRPFRPAGFRVEREAFGEKTLVHNYGHGGGGVTLSWGAAQLAVEQGFDPGVAEYAVLGAGVIGLSTARLLQERGAKVRVYARELSPDTTSNRAGAQWWPSSVFERGKIDDAFRAQYMAALRVSFRRFQLLAGPDYGVAWEANYVLSDQPLGNYPAQPGDPLWEFVVNLRELEHGHHPFAQRYARAFDTMMVETPHYLRRLEADVRLAGGEIAVRAFARPEEVAALPERVIFNCTGLGAGALFGDPGIEPVRGQLVILEPQPEVDYNVLGDDGTYMFGRRDGVVLGGTYQHGNASLEADARDTARILAGHRRIFDTMAQ